MDATLPALHLFHREMGVMRQDLKDLMVAWTVARSDEGLGYVGLGSSYVFLGSSEIDIDFCKNMGAARIGAMLLLNIPQPRTFIVMRNLLDRHCLRSLYGGAASRDDVR